MPNALPCFFKRETHLDLGFPELLEHQDGYRALDPLSALKYELNTAVLATRLFGAREGILFLLLAPSVLITRRSRTPYKAMGICRARINQVNYVF